MAGPPRQNPIGDIERFLQEVDRLRRKAAADAQRAQRGGGDDEVLEVEPVPEVLPVTPPPIRRPARPRQFDDVEVVDAMPAAKPAEVRGFPAAPAEQRGFDAGPAEQRGFTAAPQAAPAFPIGTTRTVATIARTAEIAAVSRPKAAGQLARLALNPAGEQVRALLKRENIRAAILLREVLGPPLCRRRRQ